MRKQYSMSGGRAATGFFLAIVPAIAASGVVELQSNGQCLATCTYTGMTVSDRTSSGGRDFVVACSSSSASCPQTGLTSQTITFGTAPTVQVGGTGTITIASSGASGNQVVLTSSDTNICTISGTTVTGVTAGTCTIYANQAGNAQYSAATQTSQSFSISAQGGGSCDYPTSQQLTLSTRASVQIGTGNNPQSGTVTFWFDFPSEENLGSKVGWTGNRLDTVHPPGGYTVTISQCVGSTVSVVPGCTMTSGVPIVFVKSSYSGNYCKLQPGSRYFLNNIPTTNTDSWGLLYSLSPA